MDPDSISEAYRNRYTLFVYYGLRVAMLIASLYFFVEGDFASVFSTLFVLVLISAPAILKHRYRFYLPFALDFGIVCFVFATLFLGHLANFYDYIPLWDKFVHFQSGLILGVTGFVLVYTLNEQESIHLDLSPGFVAFFAVTFSLAIGVAWELVEFVADSFFTIKWQDGNIDTMWDLIADGTGALIVSIVGYFWMFRQARLPFTPRVFKFFQKLKKVP
ncbi:hypothetical protein HY417_03000 [Candidatus Kaiserbacteria bacterium]|nr:hypothetical protein [Candidatus Kaiserbacteria bacterium]